MRLSNVKPTQISEALEGASAGESDARSLECVGKEP